VSGIGEQLAAAREKRGMTVVDAARRLNIRSSFIAAMEREDWAAVGEPVYARGFLKNYARLVGADLVSALFEFDASAQPQPVAPVEHTQTPLPLHEERAIVERIAQANATRHTWLLGSMTAMAAVLVFAVLYYTFIGPGPSSGQAQTAAVDKTQTAADKTVAGAATQSGSSQIFSNAAGSEQSVAPAPNKKGVVLRLQLTQDSWLAVTVDGKQVLYETLPAGTVRDFHANRAISLRAGNAGGVIATVDGQQLGTLGQKGQVEERVFAVKPAAPSGTGPRE